MKPQQSKFINASAKGKFLALKALLSKQLNVGGLYSTNLIGALQQKKTQLIAA